MRPDGSNGRPIGAQPMNRTGVVTGSMMGTFGMIANVHPWMAPGTPDTSIFPQTDRYTDIGFDTQYQYQGDNFWITARGSIFAKIKI